MIVAKNGNNVEAAVDFVHRHIYGGGSHGPQDAKTPDCHIAMCVSILGVSAQIGPLQLYSLDPPVTLSKQHSTLSK